MSKKVADRIAAAADGQRRGVVPVALLAMLLVFLSVVGWVSLKLRNDIREQLLSRDGHVLRILVDNQLRLAELEALEVDLFGLSPEDVWLSLLETAEADGVFAVQLFSASGEHLYSSSPSLVAPEISSSTRDSVRNEESDTRFWENASLDRFVVLADGSATSEASIVELYLPLRGALDGSSLGVARYLLEGESLAAEFALLDQRILTQAFVAAGLGCLVIFGLLAIAWRRLSQAHEAVREHARQLERANAELALFARSSALGSVTAHLIHGLKNPLAGIRQLVGGGRDSEALPDREELEDASRAANRMQAMIQEAIDVLQDASVGSCYVLTGEEMVEELRRKFSVASETGVGFSCRCAEGCEAVELESHRSGLALMIVSNLVQNALDVLESGGAVEVTLFQVGDRLTFSVADTGPGISEDVLETLFLPVESVKKGGAGIGLAVSRQLALHLSGDLKVTHTSAEGSVFELEIPIEVREGDRR